MTYKRFEEIPVWNDATNLAARVLDLSEVGIFRRFSGMRNQVERAAVSVSNNIAEGVERGTNGELLTFLYITKGSAAEVRSMLRVLERVEHRADAGEVVRQLVPLTESISRQLCGWIEFIKTSGYSGNRSQTPEERRKWEDARRSKSFDGYLNDIIEHARAFRPPDPPAPPHST